MSTGLQVSSSYRPNCWHPVYLGFRNDGDVAVARLAVLPLADLLGTAVMRLPITVPPRATMNATIWGYFTPPNLTRNQQIKGEIPPLAMVEFRGLDGSLLSRTPLVGLPLSGTSSRNAGASEESWDFVLVIGERQGVTNDALYEASWLIGELTEQLGVPLGVAKAELNRLPPEAAGLRSMKAIVLEAVDADALDRAQRDAMIEYLRSGGVLVLAAPVSSASRAGTWLAPLLPVSLIGSRMAAEIPTAPGGTTPKLTEPVEIVEAIAKEGDVLLRDGDYVHVAERRLGLGKVVFTSFPLNALQPSQPQVAALWERLLDLKAPSMDVGRSRLTSGRQAAMASMLGTRVPPWAAAAAIAGGYVLLIAAAQGIFGGAARPRAFAVSIAAAIVLTGVLLVMGMARRSGQTLQSARLDVLDIAPDGGGWRQETLAVAGADDPGLALRAADERVMIRPATADASNRPTIRQQPFAVEKAGVLPERIERVWEVSGPADAALRISAVAQLGAEGLTLDIDNGLGKTLESSLIIINGRAIAIADLPAGRTTTGQSQLNPRGQFTGLGVITSDEAKRRAQIVAASLAPASTVEIDISARPPMLIGWIADAGQPLMVANREGIESKSMTMVRTPLRFNVAPAGSAVIAEPGLVQVDTGRLPYDRAKGESVPTPQGGSWVIALGPPPQMGRMKLGRITITARVALPSHTLRLMRARSGEAIGEWNRKVGGIEATFDCTQADLDESGRVRVRLDIESSDPTSVVPWQISDLAAKIEGTIVGRAPAMTLNAPPKTQDTAESDQEKKAQ